MTAVEALVLSGQVLPPPTEVQISAVDLTLYDTLLPQGGMWEAV